MVSVSQKEIQKLLQMRRKSPSTYVTKPPQKKRKEVAVKNEIKKPKKNAPWLTKEGLGKGPRVPTDPALKAKFPGAAWKPTGGIQTDEGWYLPPGHGMNTYFGGYAQMDLPLAFRNGNNGGEKRWYELLENYNRHPRTASLQPGSSGWMPGLGRDGFRNIGGIGIGGGGVGAAAFSSGGRANPGMFLPGAGLAAAVGFAPF